MANKKSKKSNTDKYDRQHRRNLSAYEKKIDRLYRQLVMQAATIGASLSDVDSDKLFSFDDHPTVKRRVDRLLQELQQGVSTIVLNGIKTEWTLANNKNSELSRLVFGDNIGKLTEEQYRRYFSTNDAAREAFEQRKVNGLNLSDRVWKYTDQFKEEIELVLDIGIRGGMSADEMARELRQYLQYPDKLFRRVRDEHGNLQLSKRAKAFHPGQGVYRSSYKNARRLAATETNMAYMTADYTRWQQLDFVVGIEIRLSNNHTLNGKPFTDICDVLQGKYPKEFKFTGWHPLCRCYTVSILKTDEEIREDTRRILAGEPLDGESVNRVDDVPENFKQWIRDNADRYEAAAERGTLPYFIRDNQEIVDGILQGTEGSVESLEETSLQFKDPNNITRQEVKDFITAFAKNNPGMFYGGLKDVEIVRHARFFMANTRGYPNGVYDMKGNTIYITDEEFWFFSGETFNPYEELKGALGAISTGKDMTFKQEYALESLWHEIRHAQAVGWKDAKMATDSKKLAMETINQFCARHSYTPFVKSLGGKAVNTQDVIERGYGYSELVSNSKAC